MSAPDLLADIAEAADELTNPMYSIERIPDINAYRHKRLRRTWTITLPSLLDQLAAAIVPGEAYTEDEVSRAAFASRPAARLDAIDRLLAIEAGAATWCTRTILKPRDDPASNIRALVGAAPVMASGDQRTLARDLRSWRTWAATVTGWEHPPHAPRAPCPLCDARGTLRIRLAKQTGCCMACGSDWDESNIGLLTGHITRYLHTSRAAATAQRAAAVSTRIEARVIPYEPRPDLPYADDTPAR